MPMEERPRFDVRSLPIPSGRVDVYRRDDELGTGPCMSLHLAGVEVMRFDLFLACSNLVEHAPVACRLAGIDPPARQTLKESARWAKPQLKEMQ